MTKDDRSQPVAGWASAALRADVANNARAGLEGDAGDVAREHGGIVLTNVGHQFLAYWMEARGPNPVPCTSDIRPTRFRALAPYVRYLVWEGDALIHRVWGSALTEGAGIDLTGTDMFMFVPPEKREKDRHLFRALNGHPCGLVAVVMRPNAPEGAVASELLFLPVAGQDGAPDRIIGTMQWRDARRPHTDLGVRAEDVPSVEALAVSFIDVGAGTADPALLPEVRATLQ